MILHGTYNNGKITIDEKKLPHVKAKVEIKIIDELKEQKSSDAAPILNKLRGILKGVNLTVPGIKEARIKKRYGNLS